MHMEITEQNTQHDRTVPLNGPVTMTIKIADVAIRDEWQVRNKLDDTTVNTYKNIYKNGGTLELPPIQVARVDGSLLLVDGWHRLRALMLLGHHTVEATISDATVSEARWAAAKANFSHGLPLKPKEVRNVFNAYIVTRQHLTRGGRIKSYRTMEEDLGHRVSYRTLNNWMQKDHPKIAAKMAEQYGVDDKAHYHDGGPPKPDRITALEAAMASLDQAVAEARSMSPEDRGRLLAYAKGTVEGIEGAGPWTLREANSDF